jgi:hypothetical protein
LANLGYRVRLTAAMSGLAIDDELFARAASVTAPARPT